MLGVIEFEIEGQENWFDTHIIKVGYVAKIKTENSTYWQLAVTKNLLITDDLEENEVDDVEIRWGKGAFTGATLYTEKHPNGESTSCTINWVKIDGVQIYPN